MNLTPVQLTEEAALMTSRDSEIIEKIMSGMSASAVGREYNLTRERIRQILKKNGIEYSQVLKEKRAERKEQAQQQAAQRRRNRAYAVNRRNSNRAKQFTNEDIVEALRRVAGEQGVTKMSRFAYDKSRTAEDPSTALITTRFNSWNGAVEAAGLTPLGRKREYSSRWTDQEVVSWIVRFMSESSGNGGLVAYEKWTKQFNREAPSGSSIRVRRPDMSWSDWKEAAVKSMEAPAL